MYAFVKNIKTLVYNQEPGTVGRVWQVLHPHDTVVARENMAYCEEINPDFIRYQVAPSNVVVHLLKIEYKR